MNLDCDIDELKKIIINLRDNKWIQRMEREDCIDALDFVRVKSFLTCNKVLRTHPTFVLYNLIELKELL